MEQGSQRGTGEVEKAYVSVESGNERERGRGGKGEWGLQQWGVRAIETEIENETARHDDRHRADH